MKSNVHDYCGLTYAQFLVFPRAILSAMPEEWQEKFIELIEQLDEAYDYSPANGNIYYVRVGKPVEWPYEDEPYLMEPDDDLCNYRHPRVVHRKLIKENI